jgi:hypothetical protein
MSAASSFSNARATTSRCEGSQQRQIGLLGERDLTQPLPQVFETVAVDGHPVRAVGERKVMRQCAVGEHDHVVPAGPRLVPTGVGLHEAAQRVAGLADLSDRVDGLELTADLLQPLDAGVQDLTALDLDADDSSTFDGHHEVDLVVLLMVGDPLSDDHQIVVTQLLPQKAQHLLFTGVGRPRPVGNDDGHRLDLSQRRGLDREVGGGVRR